MAKIPKVKERDIERIIKRDFPEAQQAKVLSLLQDTGTENWHTEKLMLGGQTEPGFWNAERLRVWSAILKLANGNSEAIGPLIEKAKKDFRDVLAPAEYPNFWKIGFVGDDKLSKSERKGIAKQEWRQYQEWFNSK